MAIGLSVLVAPCNVDICIPVYWIADNATLIGTYKPQIHVHALSQLSLSFSRHTNALNQSFQLLSSDYSKSLHLQSDRSLEFHTPQGCHYTTRIPRYGRDLKYDRCSAEAIIPAVGVSLDGKGEVFRLNLEHGRFMRSYAVEVGGDDFDTLSRGALQGGVSAGAVNCAAVARESHNLLAFGTSRGTVEFFDPRAKVRVAFLQPPTDPLDASLLSESLNPRTETTALQFHPSGLTIGTGSSSGLIHLFDLRSNRPLLAKDHGYGYPVQSLTFLTSSSSRTSHLSSEPKVLSADKRIIKIWDTRSGDPWTSIEPMVDLNCVEWIPDTGMILTANEGRQQHSFLIPQLGPAPRWCSFIDNMVEEMTEDPDNPNAYENTQMHRAGEVFDNYKFLTQPQLEALNMAHLIGTTGMLKPYMHGYFVQQQLYEEARLVAQPEVWAEEREKRIREKIEKERESRIRGSKKVNVKVNKALAEKLVAREKKHQQRKAKRALEKASREKAEADEDEYNDEANGQAVDDDQVETATVEQLENRDSLLTDSRFSALFQNPDYAIDEQSAEFRALNASTKIQQENKEYQRDLAKSAGLTAVELEDLDSGQDSSSPESEGASGEEDNNEAGNISSSKGNTNARKAQDQRRKQKPKLNKSRKQGSYSYEPKMHVSSSAARPVSNSASESFGTRLTQERDANATRRKGAGTKGRKDATAVGEKEMTFTVSNKSKQKRSSGNGQDGAEHGRSYKRGQDRRSASGNTLRRM